MISRLASSRLAIMRVLWLVVVVFSLGFFIAGIPTFHQQLQTACVDSITCSVYGTLTPQAMRQLPSLGLSASGYATLFTIFFMIITATWSGMGLLIFWRKSNDWFALVVAFFLIAFNPTYPGSPAYALEIAYPTLALPAELVNFLGQASIVFSLFLFPNGRLVPRWLGLIVLISLVQVAASVSPPAASFNEKNWPLWLDTLVSLLSYGAILVSQVYRYRRVSTPVQRQQTKWVVFGLSIVFTGFMAFTLLFQVFFQEFNQPNTIYALLPNLAFPALFLFLPISIGIAILRYRLYDIDIIINRTLVYGLLTGVLVALYAGLTIGLEALFGLVTRQTSQPVSIVISTLAIAAFFQPLRYRIQNLIDRRFYRRKYDADRVLSAFSETLRSEVNLDQLSERLVAVVEETMQPSHVSLWLSRREAKSQSSSPLV